MKQRMLIIFLFIFLSQSLSYAGSYLFHPYIAYPTGSRPEAVAIGDVNGDGRSDVVMATSFYGQSDNDGHILVFLQNSSGELNSLIKYPTNSTYTNRSTSVAIGDVNHDGRADIVVGNCQSNIEVFLQNASGGLYPGVSYPTVNSCSIAIGDFNNDGFLDVVGIGMATNTADIFLQNVNGTLGSPVTYTITHGGDEAVDVGDMNHDGLTDIVVMNGQGYASADIGILLQQAEGTFSAPVYYDLGGNTMTHDVAIGDINNDTLQDIVVSDRFESRFSIFLQDQTGTLQPAVSCDSYYYPELVVIGDVNNDGKNDIVIVRGGTLGVYPQGTNGTLLPEVPHSLPSLSHPNPQGLAIGDINGDGANDVVIADYNNGLVVLYNINGPAIPDIEVSPSPVNFGTVFLGNSSPQIVITIYNTGTDDLTIASIEITGPDEGDFSETNACSTVKPGGTCRVTAKFTPTAEGTRNASLAITSNDPDTPAVQVAFLAYAAQPLSLFYPYVNFFIGSQPRAVAIGDVNGDGLNDVVLTTSYGSNPDNDYRMFVFLQNVSGQLEPPIKYPTNSSFNRESTSIAIGDLNHDGRADVVVGNHGSDIQVFLQNASGTLDPGISYPANSNSIKIADLNNDGLLDVVGIGGPGNSVDVLLQDTNGTLNPPVSYAIYSGSYQDVGDVNNDGLTDIVFMSANGPIGVLTQRPDGTYNSAVYYEIGPNTFSRGIAVGDLNSDNLDDVVVTYGGNQPASKMAMFFQNSGGALDPALNFPAYDVPGAVVIADIDNDGKNDVIVDHGSAIGIYFQGEAGAKLLYQNLLFANHNPQNLAVGDINGDGLNDIVRADTYGLGILYSSTGPAIPDISVSPSSISFGSVFLGHISSQTLTIYNRGTGDLINSINITGENASQFSQTNDCSTVGPGASCDISITFAAISEGTKNATLTISSNDPDTPAINITLDGYAAVNLFRSDVYFHTGSYPEAVAIGDVSGDGRNDVVMTTSYSYNSENNYHVLVFLQNSSGELDPPSKYPTNSSFTYVSESIAIGDVNHDGGADVVVGNCGSNIQVFLQNASGGLEEGISYPTGNSCGIRVGDLNNDGLLDVVGIGQNVEVFIQNSNGTLNSHGTYSVTIGGPTELEIGDVNNDGLNDIIVMSGSGPYPNIGILLQNLDGTFSSPTYYDLGDDRFTKGIAVGDINGDGLNDIVTSFNGGTAGIGVFLQNNTGTLNPAISYPPSYGSEAVVIAEVDGGGGKDVIVGHDGSFGVYLQGADGILMPEERYPMSSWSTNYSPQGLAVGDVNGDGLNDVVTTNHNIDHGLVVVYHRKPEPDVFASPSKLDFGSIPVGRTSSRTVKVSNEGLLDLNVGTITLTGTHASEFRIDADNCSGRTLITAYTCALTLSFSPESLGIKDAGITIASNDPDSPTLHVSFYASCDPIIPDINVKQNGTSIPDETGSYDFGSVNLGLGKPAMFLIENTGSMDLNLTGDPIVVIEGANAADFAVTEQPFTPVPAVWGTTAFLITFTPSGIGARSATVSIANDDPDENPYNFALCGTGNCPILGIPGLIDPWGNGVSTTPTLNWGYVPGATSYDVQVCTDSSCATVARSANVLDSIQWLVTPALDRGTSYWWRARANNACRTGVWAETLEFVTYSAGSLQFSSATYNTNEDGSTALVTVTRTGGSDGTVGVSYATSNGTAAADSDYTATSGTLSWNDGDTADKTFSIPILEDSTYEGDETVTLTLSDPTGGATLGSPSTAVLTIIDNEPAIGRALYVPEGDIQNPFISQILINNGLEIVQQSQIPDDLTNYRLLILSKNEASNKATANKIKEFVQDGGAIIIMSGTPAFLADNNNNLVDISDWFGAGSYGNDGGFGRIIINYPFGANLFVRDDVDYSDAGANRAPSVFDLNMDSIPIAAWTSSGGVHSFTHRYGNGRIFYYAGNPGLCDDPSQEMIDAGLTLFETALQWLTSGDTARVELYSPNGGEILPSGEPCHVIWGASPRAVTFKLMYSGDKGATWKLIGNEITDTNYLWQVPIPARNKKGCLLRVVGYDSSGKKVGVADNSDVPFTIEVIRLASPNGGESLVSGNERLITWNTHATIRPIATIQLSYTFDGGVTWKSITTLPGEEKEYRWRIPTVKKLKSKCRVKVALKDASGTIIGSDRSDTYFTVNP